MRKNEVGYANIIFSREEDAYKAKLEMDNKIVTFCKLFMINVRSVAWNNYSS